MIGGFLARLFGSRNQRVLKRMGRIVAQINALEPKIQVLTDSELQAKTAEFRAAVQQGKKLDDLLPEAFAVVREASKRTLNMRHFDVQMIGGMSLHHGKIAEQHTGEGKTLVATLAAYLNSLSGDGVHVITVNDYLARRDANWMGPLYAYLGLSVGVVVSGMTSAEKRDAYAADITYGTNNEFGFDYLRDNMAFSLGELVQRKLNYAIVDEVDSILIDEARTPLIISGPAEDSSELYKRINAVVPKLMRQLEEDGPGDFSVDEKSRQIYFTEAGHETVEKMLVQEGLLSDTDSLYAAGNVILMHHLLAALRAHHLFGRDVDYIVRDDEVIIVDEHTGRTMPGRRWSEGLHQAVEAKEGVTIKNENQTLASITFQNYFRLYNKLSGMTGTADTEAYEFHQIYGLEVIVIPTNQPNRREDFSDLIFLTKEEKFAALIKDIKECQDRKQPVLVGTASIETSEYCSGLLEKENIPHNVLNAKFHEQEAQIIADAGMPGKVTIATNMAGRGTDIVLGGSFKAEIAGHENPSDEHIAKIKSDWEERHNTVVAAGGLRVIGSERHESRRIDNQLRGRCARQGDPGSTRFYLSLDDNLMRIFAPPKLKNIMMKLGMGQGEAIESRLVTRSIENAQRKVEGHNFDIRKNLLQFDDVANEQRKVIYEQRREIMGSEDLGPNVKVLREDVINEVVNKFIPPNSVEELWDVAGLEKQLEQDFSLKLPIQVWLNEDEKLYEESLRKKILEQFDIAYQEKEKMVNVDVIRQFEKAVMLQQLDMQWKDHLAAMDYLRQGINLRGYAARDPRQEYKREAFKLFELMLDRVKYDIISILSRFQVRAQEDVDALEAQRRDANDVPVEFNHTEIDALSASDESAGTDNVVPFERQNQKPGRNDACFCGSGKKYKQCHGQIE